jgi:hypothetical protein
MLRLTGVAPDAKLLIYKVFADVRKYYFLRDISLRIPQRSRRTDEELIIQAFCDAYKAGV